MKVAICDYKEPLNRDLEIEKSVFKKFLEKTQKFLFMYMKVIMRNLKKQLKM